MANDHNTEPPRHRVSDPRTDVTSRSTGDALRPVTGTVAPTRGGDHSAAPRGEVIARARLARRIERTIHRPGASQPLHNRDCRLRNAPNMISPSGVSQRQWTVRATVVENVRHTSPVTRMASWMVDVVVPMLIPDHVAARFNTTFAQC